MLGANIGEKTIVSSTHSLSIFFTILFSIKRWKLMIKTLNGHQLKKTLQQKRNSLGIIVKIVIIYSY